MDGSDGVSESLCTFGALLSAQGAVGRAVSRKDSNPEAVAAHLEDCLAGLTAIPGDWAGQTVVDVGSGYGLPGIVAALARPNIEKAVLLEPSARRGTFLRRAIIETGANAEVVSGSAPEAYELLGLSAEPCARTVVLVRALAPPAETIELVNALLTEEATLLYWFGRRATDREAKLEAACDQAELAIEMFQPEMLESRGWIAIIRRCG
ncbi:MAG: hypothetical protein DCC49_09170 [Acidobacteria bacterium]|nr:MAG: hypothetical protein DCC49_09170 [Acidobacteriota bacterium]